MAYGVSGILIIALLLSTVVMLNNYGELKNIKQTLSNFNMKQEAQAVNQILNSETTPETTGKKKMITEKVRLVKTKKLSFQKQRMMKKQILQKQS